MWSVHKLCVIRGSHGAGSVHVVSWVVTPCGFCRYKPKFRTNTVSLLLGVALDIL